MGLSSKCGYSPSDANELKRTTKMRLSSCARAPSFLAVVVLLACPVAAQTEAELHVMQGLAPVTALEKTEAGKAALAVNLGVTGAIQDGTSPQPTLLPLPEQQQQALRDAYITGDNAYGISDGLGSALGAAYQSATGYSRADDGKTINAPNIAPSVAQFIAYANATSRADSNLGKYFFANGTLDGKAPVSAAALAILTEIGGATDMFGRAYGRPAGSAGANRYGNSRPFQTEPHFLAFEGVDFFGATSGNVAWLRGPAQDLTHSASYPSGHTTYGYMESLLLALLVPQRYPQMVVRAAEYGSNRITIGAHYAMDVLGGRTLATYDLAQLLANKPGYVGVKRGKLEIADFRKALADARADVTKTLEDRCGKTIAACAADDRSRFADAARNDAFHASTQTYGLPVVFAETAGKTADVGKLAPEAGYLLTAAFPYLTLDQANAILTATQGPGGGFLDNGSAFGVYSRLDLYRAAQQAIAADPSRQKSSR
jgi:membrane-associated phospholipid phosphatase